MAEMHRARGGTASIEKERIALFILSQKPGKIAMRKKYPAAQQYLQKYRAQVKTSSAEALLLGIKLARVFEDKDEEASYVLTLKNLYPRSDEYLEYLKSMRPSQQ